MVSLGFWCFPTQSQLHSGTKPHQKDRERYRSRKALGDFGELESLKSYKFRSDVTKAQQQPTVLESLGVSWAAALLCTRSHQVRSRGSSGGPQQPQMRGHTSQSPSERRCRAEKSILEVMM